MKSSVPKFDKNTVYESKFHVHRIQKYVALFISKPSLYADIATIDPAYRQKAFFKKFHLFIEKYYNLNVEKDYDGVVYFSNLQLDKLGSANITGGCGKLSNSARKQRLAEYHQSQEMIKQAMLYFSEKYNMQFDQSNDPRMFIGHKEIWKSPSIALLEKENWGWVSSSEYSDATFTQPIPIMLDIDLVPLKIRNKVYQLWQKQRFAEKNTTIAKEIEPSISPVIVETLPSPPQVVINDELNALLEEW